jgi:hypothetical protein
VSRRSRSKLESRDQERRGAHSVLRLDGAVDSARRDVEVVNGHVGRVGDEVVPVCVRCDQLWKERKRSEPRGLTRRSVELEAVDIDVVAVKPAKECKFPYCTPRVNEETYMSMGRRRVPGSKSLALAFCRDGKVSRTRSKSQAKIHTLIHQA